MNKKAQTQIALVRIILLAFAVVILIGAFIGISASIGEKRTDELCIIDVSKQQILKKANSGTLNTLNLHSALPNCQNWNIKIYNDHVEKFYIDDQKKQEFRDLEISIYENQKYKKFKELDEDIVNWVVAEELANCWRRFNEAKKPIFLDNTWYTNDFKDDNVACFICSTIQFDVASVKENTYGGFHDFIQVVNYKGDQTYYDYVIDNNRQCDQYKKIINEKPIDINTRKLYNLNYGWSLDESKSEITNFNQLPDNACWNFFIDGITLSVTNARGSNVVTTKVDEHDIIQRDIQFNKLQTYNVVLVRMGDDSAQTYFSYVVPNKDLPQLCDKVAI